MRKFILLIVILAVIALIWRDRSKSRPVPETEPSVEMSGEAAPQVRPPALEIQKSDVRQPQQPITNSEPPPIKMEPEALSVEAAAIKAWYTAEHVDELFNQNAISAPLPAPDRNEALVFRGYLGPPPRTLYIEIRFSRGQWIVLEGDAPDALIARPPRDVIPFLDRDDVWTIYFGQSERFMLMHLAKVTIPDHEGEFEVLSGWLASPDLLRRVALIGDDNSWPSLELISKIFPKNPNL